jgi:2-methylcitrate dehydratase PrpD
MITVQTFILDSSELGEGYTEKLLDYALSFRYRDISENVVDHSKTVILDTIGAMLTASDPRYSASRLVMEFIKNLEGREEATIVGRSFKAPAIDAAFVNGVLGYMCDIESYHVGAVLHETAAILPSTLAVGERCSVSGKDVVTSFVLGLDLETRLSYALNPSAMYARGFHPSVVTGCIGSAVSSGKLLGLSGEKLANAFGLAASQSCGLLAWESDVTEMSRPFGIGVAARNGVTAALLASSGFGGPEVLEGKYTIFDAFSGESHLEKLFDGLGGRFEVMNQTFKRYSSCAFTHPGLDALLKILGENGLEAEEIEGITVRFPARGAKLIDGSELKSHNIQYVLSVAAIRGRVTIGDILFEQYDEGIWDLVDRVELVHDVELDSFFPEKMPTIVEVKTRSGKIYVERVDSTRGTPENPFSRSEVREKFLFLATTVINEDHAAKIMEVVDRLEFLPDVHELTELLCFKQQVS